MVDDSASVVPIVESPDAITIIIVVWGAGKHSSWRPTFGRQAPPATIARDGYDKPAIREFIFEHARFPLGRLGDEYRRQQVDKYRVIDDPASMVPIVESPDAISIIVVGGAGKHSSWQPTFGRPDPAGDARDHAGRATIRAHLLRWCPRPPAQRTESTPRRLPSGAASQLDPSHRSSWVSPTAS